MAVAINGMEAMSIGHLPAAVDLSTHMFKFVKLTSTGVNLVSAVTDATLGVLCNKPKAGQPCHILSIGVTEVIAGVGTIIAGDSIFLMATGLVDETATSTRVGQALEIAANGKLFTAYINVGGVLV